MADETQELPSIKYDDQRTWEFVRTAGPGDPSPAQAENGSLWDAGANRDGTPVLMWLTPRGVQRAGLVDKMREGIEAERRAGVRATHPFEQEPEQEATSAEDWWQGMELQGGHTDDWRWEFVEGLVIIDNRPALERDRREAFSEGRAPDVQYQTMCVPAEVLVAAVSMLPQSVKGPS